MKKTLLIFGIFLAGLLATPASAQNPDCQINFGPWTDTNASPPSDNRVTQCTYWVLNYQVTGFSVISLQFESATGATFAGTFGAYSGTVNTGVNPSTSVACSTPTNCTATFVGSVGWYRMNFPTHTGAGSIKGTLQGYKTGYALGGAAVAGSGCPGTVGTPCVVAGMAADGSPVAGAPVRIGGKDTAGNTQDVFLGMDGSVIINHAVVAVVDGLTPSKTIADDLGLPIYYRMVPLVFNGATWDREFACTNTAPITFTAASGAVEIVPLVAAKVIRVCSILLSSDTVTNITLEYGTGSACGTGTTGISGPIQNVLTFSMSWNPDTAIRTASANAFCIDSSATATIGGTVTYAQF